MRRERAVGCPDQASYLHVPDCCSVWYRHLRRLRWWTGYGAVCDRKDLVGEEYDHFSFHYGCNHFRWQARAANKRQHARLWVGQSIQACHKYRRGSVAVQNRTWMWCGKRKCSGYNDRCQRHIMVRKFVLIPLWGCLAALNLEQPTNVWLHRLPSGSSLAMTDSAGNSTICQLDAIGGANALAVATIAGDGMLLLSSQHGELSLLA